MRRRVLLSGNGGDIDYSKVYFTMVVTTGGNITWAGSTTANTLSYSKDDGETWTTADSTTIISVVKGDNVLWKGTPTPTSKGIGTFSSSCNFTVEGNAMSLLYGDNFSGQTSLSGKDYTFKNLFSGSTGVTSAANMVLPATTLAIGCYNGMFQGCTSLTTAPELPATTLAKGCYYYMFLSCTSLTTAPELPATTLANGCYWGMFYGCTSLTTVPSDLLPATTLAVECYYSMFTSCTSLTTAPVLPATTLASSCYASMFYGCTSLTTAPVLPATTLASSCYASMFYGCTSLTTAPELPATTLAVDCYRLMFQNCTSLTTVHKLPATTLASGCYASMFYGCTSLTTAPVLPATTLASSCYASMFRGCTSLSSIKCLATDISVRNCTSNWVKDVAASGTFTKAASMSGWTTGINGIPTNWVVEDYSDVHVTGVTLNTTATTITKGNTTTLTATVLPNNATDKRVTWSTSDANVATIDSDGVVSGVASGSATITVTTTDGGYTAQCSVTVAEVSFKTINIEGASSVSAETCTFRAICDNVEDVTSSATWSITDGSQYATINPNNGVVTILNGANESSVGIQAVYAGLTATTTVTLTYVSGAVSETTSVITTDVGGNSTSVVRTITTYADSSSTEVVETVVTDVNGDLVGSTESTTTNNADGSYNGVTTNYDENGDPVNGSNVTGDTEGNVSTQTVEYDDNGNTTVTGYDIDTSGNPQGSKNYNNDGVNTEFYALDVTQGFVMDIHFTIDFTQQPPNQNDGHHNIINSKRATPEPWYGFQVRQSQTNKYIQLGTQFSTGSNANTTITTTNANKYNGSSNVYEYNLHIVYDPTASSNKFTCDELIGDAFHYTANNTFPDIEDLKYIKTTVGCALDANGDPFRFSNINVFAFSIEKLKKVATPQISCDGREVTITCETAGATIYYRLNNSGSYTAYTTPISINADTVVQAYGELNGDRSNMATETCYYDNGIATPVITCDGEYVSIACATTDATLYYRLNETGTFSEYTEPFEINATTVVEAYAQVGSETGHTAKETCTYAPVVLVAPVILCNGEQITITCATQSATINYRLNQEGTYQEYTTPITILQDTFVETYSTFRGRVSSVVSETCEYSPIHHYENDYLTFKIRTAGTLYWRANGSLARDIQYSLNDGTWTTLTSAATPPTITVAVNDVVRFKGTNQSYATNKTAYSGFGQGEAGQAGAQSYDSDAAELDIEGNIMSLVYGDNFVGQTAFNGGTYNFCSIFKKLKVVSAENLILPATTLTQYCYRAMFSWCTYLTEAPQLPATTLAKGVYWYMFERCAITTAPDLLAEHLVAECYGSMFTSCSSLNFIKCMAIDGFTTTNCKQNWVQGVASSGTFVKDSGITTSTWSTGNNGIPKNWLVYDDVPVVPPTITYDGFSEITLTCDTQGATIYYKLNNTGNYATYSTPITISGDTIIQTYSELNGQESRVISQTCLYVSDVPIEYSNRDLKKWQYGGAEITTPYSVNAIDGHSSNYAKGTFNFENSFALRQAQPTYLWFQHADQSASIYVNDTLVEKHWGGYTAFTTDISNYVQIGNNTIKVQLKNNEGNYLAPAAGDFNFNATLGNVKLLTSPCLPAMNYGYDGFHVTSDVTTASATIYVRTTVPTGSSVMCSITDGTYSWSDTIVSDGTEMTFSTTINNPHLWNGKSDPHLYTITMEISKDNVLYHRFVRPYGLRFYEYVINDITKVGTSENPYTGFLLNGSPYLLRGCCMHDDIEGRANALTETDYNNTFATIQELGVNFLRLAHYPHPKEVYDRCDQLGIIVQTEGPCVNKLQSTMPTDYYTHLETQYTDMVNQHYNHPCIFFWGLSNETTTDDKAFGKTKVEGYTALIKNLDSERMVGYVLAQSPGTSPSAYYNDPSNVDWFGCNIYVGWYDSPNSNTPVSQINTRLNNTINRVGKPMAYSEYGCGGTQRCHSDDFMNTTTRGNHERHDIEYMMWLHEGHIATIKQYPQLMFTAQWQLFDIAVANRNEGYTVCLDGENTSIDDNLRRLNNKGLVERDHVTKKDPFYLYKAWWNPTPFVHICQKDYTKMADRVIKCYTNQATEFALKVNGTTVETKAATDNILTFTGHTFSSGDVVTVESGNISDTFTFE